MLVTYRLFFLTFFSLSWFSTIVPNELGFKPSTPYSSMILMPSVLWWLQKIKQSFDSSLSRYWFILSQSYIILAWIPHRIWNAVVQSRKSHYRRYPTFFLSLHIWQNNPFRSSLMLPSNSILYFSAYHTSGIQLMQVLCAQPLLLFVITPFMSEQNWHLICDGFRFCDSIS